MSHSLPVVASQVGGLDEQVDHGKTGYLVDHRDLQAFVQFSLDLLKSEEKRNKFGEGKGESSIFLFGKCRKK